MRRVPITAKEIRLEDGDTRIIQPDRIFLNKKGIPTIQFPANDAQAWNPFDRAVALTPEEYDEAGRNNYISQVRGLLGGEGLGRALPWIMIGLLVLAIIINGTMAYQTGESVNALGEALRNAHPPTPAPQPTR